MFELQLESMRNQKQKITEARNLKAGLLSELYAPKRTTISNFKNTQLLPDVYDFRGVRKIDH